MDKNPRKYTLEVTNISVNMLEKGFRKDSVVLLFNGSISPTVKNRLKAVLGPNVILVEKRLI